MSQRLQVRRRDDGLDGGRADVRLLAVLQGVRPAEQVGEVAQGRVLGQGGEGVLVAVIDLQDAECVEGLQREELPGVGTVAEQVEFFEPGHGLDGGGTDRAEHGIGRAQDYDAEPVYICATSPVFKSILMRGILSRSVPVTRMKRA